MKAPRVEIDEAKLADNMDALRQSLRPGADLMAVVKSDAYGHGLERVVAVAGWHAVRRFAVVSTSEALRCRAAAPESEILMLGIAEPSDVPVLLEKRIGSVIVSLEQAQVLGAAARAAGGTLPVHLKIDSGMGRIGIVGPDAETECAEILRVSGLDVQGICSHLAQVTPGAQDPACEQARRFTALAEAIDAQARRHLFRHLSNSRGFFFHPEWDFDAVRTGISLYGYGAEAGDPQRRRDTQPVLQWKAYVAQVRSVPGGFPVGYDSTFVTSAPTTLATVAVGYADGYPRRLGNRAHVVMGGHRCPVVGRVSMNWITVDAGPDAPVEEGAEAVLIGRQGRESIWADELATLCDTIPYEILTGIHPALERVPVSHV